MHFLITRGTVGVVYTHFVGAHIQRFTFQQILGNIHFTQISKSRNTGFGLHAILLQRDILHLMVVKLTLTVKIEMHESSVSHFSTQKFHNLILQFSGIHILTVLCRFKDRNDKVFTFRNDHKLHSRCPVAQTVIFKMVIDKLFFR